MVRVALEPPVLSTKQSSLDLSEGTPLLQQSDQRTPVGALTSRGTVYVNQIAVPNESTVFIGDTIHTDADAAASVAVAGRGTFVLASQTELAFVSEPQYLAVLRVGTLGIRSLSGARNFQVRVRDLIVVPAPDAAATVEIKVTADGTARFTCTGGSVGLIALRGEEVQFLRAGQSADLSAQGALSLSTMPTGTPTPPSPPQVGAKSHTGVIVAVLAGAGAAGAAVALSRGKKESTPVSPSQP
jgi:hypothetical protein